MIDERPAWARRMTNERKVRNWSQADAVRALKAHAEKDQPIHADDANLLRQWKRWEDGEVEPGDFYKPIIARMFGTVTHAFFPVPSRRDADSVLDLGDLAGTLGLKSCVSVPVFAGAGLFGVLTVYVTHATASEEKVDAIALLGQELELLMAPGATAPPYSQYRRTSRPPIVAVS